MTFIYVYVCALCVQMTTICDSHEVLVSAMQRPNEPGHNRPDCFVIDDWR